MASRQPNWAILNGIAASYYASSPLLPDVLAAQRQDGLVRTGLCVSLADVVGDAGDSPLAGALVVAVDTLQVPAGDTNIAAAGCLIIARSVAVDGGGAATLTVQGGSLQVMTSGISGALEAGLADPSGKSLGGPIALALDSKAPVPQILTLDQTKATELQTSSALVDVADVMHSPWSILALGLSFAAAGYLVEDGTPSSLDLAAGMLAWVTANANALIRQRSEFPTVDFANVASLQSGAVSLLVFTQASASGAVYVPVLSGDVYKTEVNALLEVAEAYDSKIRDLEQSQEQAKLLESFADTLSSVSKTAETPLYNTLARLSSQVGQIETELRNASVQLAQVSATLGPLQDALSKAIEDEFQKKLLDLAFSILTELVSLYIGVAAIAVGLPPEAEIKEAAKAGQEALKGALEIAEKLIEGGEKAIEGAVKLGADALGDNLSSTSAADATAGAQALMASVASFSIVSGALWQVVDSAVSSGKGRIDVSKKVLDALDQNVDLSGFSVAGLDPVTYWDKTVIQVEGAVQQYQTGPTAGAANAYLEAVKTAAVYGKSVGDLQSKLLDLYTQGISAFDRLQAVYAAEDDWKQLQGSLDTVEAQAAAAIGLLQRGYTDVKRNVILAVNNYRAAFFYQWLQESDVRIDASMDYLEMVQAAESSITSLQNVLVGKGTSALQPRQTLGNIDLSYTVKAADGPLFQEVNGQGRAVWSITSSNPVLADQINGNTAIYLTEVVFILNGAEQTEEVEMTIQTSGHFDNRLGQSQHRFVARAIQMVSDYRPTKPPKFVPWKFADAAAYLMPTPYTQWTLTVQKGNWQDATSIEMRIRAGYFLQNPAGG